MRSNATDVINSVRQMTLTSYQQTESEEEHALHIHPHLATALNPRMVEISSLSRLPLPSWAHHGNPMVT